MFYKWGSVLFTKCEQKNVNVIIFARKVCLWQLNFICDIDCWLHLFFFIFTSSKQEWSACHCVGCGFPLPKLAAHLKPGTILQCASVPWRVSPEPFEQRTGNLKSKICHASLVMDGIRARPCNIMHSMFSSGTIKKNNRQWRKLYLCFECCVIQGFCFGLVSVM